MYIRTYTIEWDIFVLKIFHVKLFVITLDVCVADYSVLSVVCVEVSKLETDLRSELFGLMSWVEI